MKILGYILLFIQTIDSLELSKYWHCWKIKTWISLEKLSTCQTSLGMQSGSIPDLAITVSSSYDWNTVGSKASR